MMKQNYTILIRKKRVSEADREGRQTSAMESEKAMFLYRKLYFCSPTHVFADPLDPLLCIHHGTKRTVLIRNACTMVKIKQLYSSKGLGR